jgi:hypothetical protein
VRGGDKAMTNPLDPDPATLDPHGHSLLEAQRLAAERMQIAERELVRLRRVDAAARRAVQVWGQEGEADALEALVAALEGTA